MNGNDERDANALRYLAWLKGFDPELHAMVMERLPEKPPSSANRGLGATHYHGAPGMDRGDAPGLGRMIEVPGFGRIKSTRSLPGSEPGFPYRPVGTPELGQMFPTGIAAGAPTVTVEEKPWWESVVDTISDVGSAYLQWDAQKDVLEVQKERIKQGLPPIDTEVLAPTVRIQHDLPPDFQQEISTRLGGMGNILLWVGAGLAAWMLLR